jgi:hypothetical protein
MFCEESYSAFPTWFKFIVIVILNQLNIKKNKIDKDNFEKNHKKKPCGKHCSNPQCFVRKATTVILNQLNIKKIKSTNNFEKNHNKKKLCGETL